MKKQRITILTTGKDGTHKEDWKDGWIEIPLMGQFAYRAFRFRKEDEGCDYDRVEELPISDWGFVITSSKKTASPMKKKPIRPKTKRKKSKQ